MQGMKFLIQDTKPWYLCGSGCFKRREKATQPKLKMDRKKLRKVSSSVKVRPSKARALSSQLGILDREANQLLVDLHGRQPASEGYSASRDLSTTAFMTAAPSPGTYAIEDDYSEDELAKIFQAQTAKIENAFNQPVEEPASFRRAFPYSSEYGDNKLASLPGKQEEDACGTALGGGSSSTRPSSTVFLTGVVEEPRSQRFTAATPTGGTSFAESSGSRNQTPASLNRSASGANLMGSAALATASGTLPPISQPGSRGSSAGGISRSDPLDMLLKDSGTRTKAMPDVGVREAMKALRAAAQSEFAVAM